MQNANDNTKWMTVAPVSSIPMPGSTDGLLPEFVRAAGVEKFTGLKRGQLYLLTKLGLLRSVSLRAPGRKFGTRLWHLPSLLEFLRRRLLEQERLAHGEVPFGEKVIKPFGDSCRNPGGNKKGGEKLLKLKLNISQQVLAPEGVHVAKVKSVRPNGESKVAVDFAFTANGKQFIASKGYKAELVCGSELLHDIEIILDQTLECSGENLDVDLDTLIGRPCQVLVLHKRSSGGKRIAPVETVLPAVNEEPVAA